MIGVENGKMTWRLALSLETLRKQVNAVWPKRKKASDGTIGDAKHASRSSDHNPWITEKGKPSVVTAFDITHDPTNGPNCHHLAEAIIKDPRVKYVIWNRRIWNKSVSPKWRDYDGSNQHTKHMHVSVKYTKAHYDNEKEWALS